MLADPRLFPIRRFLGKVHWSTGGFFPPPPPVFPLAPRTPASTLAARGDGSLACFETSKRAPSQALLREM